MMPSMRMVRMPRPRPRHRRTAGAHGRVVVRHAVVPGGTLGRGRRRGAQVAAALEDPDEQNKTGDGPDDDAGDGAAREGGCVVWVVDFCGCFVGVRDDGDGWGYGLLAARYLVEGAGWVGGEEGARGGVDDVFEEGVFEFGDHRWGGEEVFG